MDFVILFFQSHAGFDVALLLLLTGTLWKKAREKTWALALIVLTMQTGSYAVLDMIEGTRHTATQKSP